MNKFLNISQAKKYLNVHQSTLYRWEKKGLLVPSRHPCNNRRIYEKKKLEKFKEENICKSVDPTIFGKPKDFDANAFQSYIVDFKNLVES